jgi:putative membrane protein
MRTLARLAVACVAAALIVIGVAAHAQAQTAKADAFAKAAAEGISFQAQAARLAGSVSTNTEVKAFAVTMLADYSAAVTKFKQAASDTAVKEAPEDLTGKLKDMIDKLKMAPTASFDSLFVDTQVAMHRDLLVLFTDYAGSGENPALKKFAADFLLVLQDHQIRLEKLAKALPRPA